MARQQSLRLQRVHGEFILRAYGNQLICHESQRRDRGFPRQTQRDRDPLLAKDVDLPAAVVGLARADGEQGLHRIVCQHTYLRVDAVASYLVICRVRHDDAGGHLLGGEAIPRLELEARRRSRPKDPSESPPACPSKGGPSPIFIQTSCSARVCRPI